MDSVRNDERIYVRLERGEEVLASLEKLRDKYEIENGFFQGIGAVDQVKLGNYDVETEEYREEEFEGTFEVPSLTGNIGPDKIHAHISVSDPDFSTMAGHCGMAKISGTMEIIVLVDPDVSLNHGFDPSTGLDVFDLPTE